MSALQNWMNRLRLSLMERVITKPQPKPLMFVGPGASGQLADAIAGFGVSRLLVVTDKPLRELGVLNPMLAALKAAGVDTHVYDGVLPDPTEKIVDDGIAALQAQNCGGVLAFGGGSSIDSAKVIALGAANGCSAAQCKGVNQCDKPALPFFAVPTTAGTGSEGTFIAVISDNQTHAKGSVVDNKLIPRAAALDPELMRGLPPQITAATGMDALTHAIESYIGTWETQETNFYGLASARLVLDNLATACSNGDDLKAREAMALASYYGGLAITNALVGYVHAISHNIGARYGIPHGLGNALALPHVLDAMQETAAGKMAEIAVHCGLGEAGEGDVTLARKLVGRVRELNREIGIPETTDLIPAGEVNDLVEAIMTEGGRYPTPRFLDKTECKAIVEQLRAA